MAIGYLFDEHLRGTIPAVIARHAMQTGFRLDLVQVGDVPGLPLGSKDTMILEWAEKGDRIVVSLDRATMIGHFWDRIRAGGHSPGLFVLRDAPLVEVANFLILAQYTGAEDEWNDSVTYVP